MIITSSKTIENGLEAIIKHNISCCGTKDGIARVFLDSSVGCGLGCSHCWIKDTKLEMVDPYELDKKILKSLGDKTYNLKLMGQGDALLVAQQVINRLNNSYYSITNKNKPVSLSLSTIFPGRGSEHKSALLNFADRVYLSVIDPYMPHRSKQAPAALNLNTAINIIKRCDTELRLHFTPTRENATFEKLKMLRDICLEAKAPLRLIRHHTTDGVSSVDTLHIAEQMVDMGVPTTVAISAGIGNNTACGMFG